MAGKKAIDIQKSVIKTFILIQLKRRLENRSHKNLRKQKKELKLVDIEKPMKRCIR